MFNAEAEAAVRAVQEVDRAIQLMRETLQEEPLRGHIQGNNNDDPDLYLKCVLSSSGTNIIPRPKPFFSDHYS